jgi:hypothetical protein
VGAISCEVCSWVVVAALGRAPAEERFGAEFGRNGVVDVLGAWGEGGIVVVEVAEVGELGWRRGCGVERDVGGGEGLIVMVRGCGICCCCGLRGVGGGGDGYRVGGGFWRIWIVANGAGNVENIDVVAFELSLCFDFLVVNDFAVSAEEHLSQVTEDSGFTWSDLVLGGGEEDFGEDAKNVLGRVEGARGLVEFGSEKSIKAALIFGMGLAEMGIGRGGQVAARASGARDVLAVSGGERIRIAFHFGPRRGDESIAASRQLTAFENLRIRTPGVFW